jgi:hypothetical protein
VGAGGEEGRGRKVRMQGGGRARVCHDDIYNLGPSRADWPAGFRGRLSQDLLERLTTKGKLD